MIQKGFEWDGNGVPPVVAVQWNDCQGQSSWVTVKKAFNMEPAHCRTVGYLLEWSDHVLRLSGALVEEGKLVTHVSNTDVIPAGWVVLVTELIHA